MPDHPESIVNFPQLIVDEHWLDTIVIISCSGAIDMLTAPELERRIATALQKSPTSVIVDLTFVDFLAAHGMQVLVATDEICFPAVDFAVIADGPVTRRPMQLIGVADVISIYGCIDDAFKKLGA